jgi:5-hydroxyisourate hydrolase
MSAITTHVLDTSRGVPAAGVPVRLEGSDGGVLATATTDDDGRVGQWGPDTVRPGTYRLVVDTAAYFAATDQPCFYPEVTVSFTITDTSRHHHVPLLLSPYAYSTYRGS